MRIIVTGGAGFIGTLLARRLLAGPVAIGGAAPVSADELYLADLAAPPSDVAADPRVRPVTGDLPLLLGGIADADAIFHLAAVPSAGAEADFDLGMRTNVHGTLAVLERARRQARPPVLVFSSTLAVFGTDPGSPVGWVGAADTAGTAVTVVTVGEDTLPTPQSSYGSQKFAAEQFVADYTRRGFVRGRCVRLMTVTVRPGRPNAAASSFMSGIIREPLAGVRAACPVPADTPIALSSPSRTLEGILRAAEVGDADWGSRTAMNLPALTTTPREMAEAMDRVAGRAVSDLIDWSDDQAIGAIVRSWPAAVDTPRAGALGLRAVGSFDDIVREYLGGSGKSAAASSPGS